MPGTVWLPVSDTGLLPFLHSLTSHRPYDPEGFLGVLSACNLTYLGLMAGTLASVTVLAISFSPPLAPQDDAVFSSRLTSLVSFVGFFGESSYSFLLVSLSPRLSSRPIALYRLPLWVQTKWRLHANQ
jgi:hypothetical protein